jgi:hypothetical protein
MNACMSASPPFAVTVTHKPAAQAFEAHDAAACMARPLQTQDLQSR